MLRGILSLFQNKDEVKPYESFETYNYSSTSIDPATDAGLAFGQAQNSIASVKNAYNTINQTANNNSLSNTERATAVKQAYNVNLNNASSSQIKGEPQVFAVGPPSNGYIYTFAEAPSICAKYGAKLATTAQLEEAQRNGADWWFSGWVAEGSGKWPITLNPINGCGNRTGIIEWTPGPKAGVTCYGPKPDITDPAAKDIILPFNQQMWNQPPPSDTPTYLTIPSGYLESSGPQPACFGGLSPEQAQQNCNAYGPLCVGFSYSRDGKGNGCYKGNHNAGINGNSAYMGYVKTQTQPPPSVIIGRYIKFQYNRQEWLNLAQILVYSTNGGPNILTPNTVVTKSSGYQGDSYPSRNIVDGKGNTFVHTSGNEIPWIQVDLGTSLPIYKVVIVNRKDCCKERILGAVLSILDDSNTPIYMSNWITSTNTVYTWFPPKPDVNVDRPEDMPKIERDRTKPPPGYSQNGCYGGYYDRTKGNRAFWACGAGCPGGKYWTDWGCSCACVPNAQDP